jgi:two-component system, NtrC family, nitrogen regulation sensor histidine kinase NtrY
VDSLTPNADVPSPGVTGWKAMVIRWRRNPNFWARLEIALTLLLLVTAAASYVLLTTQVGTIDASPGRRLLWLLILNGFLLAAISTLIGRRVLVLFRNRQRGIAGSRLHLRMTSIFALLAIVPTILVAIYATLLFEFGFAFWFSDNVRSILVNANSVANAYVIENRERIRGDILALRNDLIPVIAEAGNIGFQVQFEREVTRRNLDEAVIFQRSKDGSYLEFVAEVRFGKGILQEKLQQDDVRRAESGNLVVRSGEANEKDNIIQALVRFDGKSRYFLYVNRRASPEVLRQVASTRDALAQYSLLNEQRRSILIRFMGLLGILSMIVLLAATLAALYSADRLIAPIGKLIRAANKVGDGDLSARVPIKGQADDLGALSQTFNRMTSQLQQQRSALVAANEQLDGRRRFTEAVLSGVSAGVLGVSHHGIITLPNQSAELLLGLSEHDLTGRQLVDVVPEMAQLLDQARNDINGMAIGPVVITIGKEVQRTFMVQITAEGRGAVAEFAWRGFVVTFDDVTEALANQRRAAWSDVARRIAHEIKNPLTPIQLSAERLRRKYLAEIKTDPDVFIACTDTIVRQVKELRRMVDEFSSFARMPKPVFRQDQLQDILRQSAFLLELANPATHIHLHLPESPIELLCDRQQLAQAFTNVFKNAIESTHSQIERAGPHYQSELNITLSRISPTATVIVVEDNGIGLPATNQDLLFEPYVTTREKGTGLGLAIVKKIIEDHCGTLTIANRSEGGAIVTMSFDDDRLSEQLQSQQLVEKVRYGA